MSAGRPTSSITGKRPNPPSPVRSGAPSSSSGVEPNLKWRTFSETIANLALDLGVKTVVHLGALLDAVPHTREVRLTGSSTLPLFQKALDSANISSSNYQGPTGISTAVMETCTRKGMGYASLWGHTSHYLQAAPNYRVSYTLAETISRLLDLPVNLAELRSAAEKFDGGSGAGHR